MGKKLCASCLKETEEAVCPHCGYPEQVVRDTWHMPLGMLLKGRYKVGQCVDTTKMEAYHPAWDCETGTRVTVREFHPMHAVHNVMAGLSGASGYRLEAEHGRDDPFRQAKEFFAHKTLLQKALGHAPGIVRVLDSFEENGTFYAVLEERGDIDLRGFVERQGGKIPAQLALRLLEPVVRILAEAQKKGIVHGGLQPECIIIDPIEGPKLRHLGCMEEKRLLKRPEEEDEISAAVYFDAIECGAGKCGPQSDVYSLCAIFIYCIGGIVPPTASTRLEAGREPDWSVLADLTDHQQAVIRQGYQVRPEHRIRDVETLYRALYEGAEPEVPVQRTQEKKGRGQARTKKAREKKGRKKKGLGLLIGAAAVAVLAAAFFLWQQFPSYRYVEARVYLQLGKYDQAIHSFRGLEDYGDSEEMLLESLYGKAGQHAEQGRYKKAAEGYEELGDYRDSPEKARECRYAYGDQLLAQGDHAEALEIFTALGDYSNSPEKVLDCHYAAAEELLAKGRYQEAANAFRDLKDHRDSRARVRECDYALASQWKDEGKYEQAAKLFLALGDYQDSPERYLDCCLLGADLLIGRGEYLEALALLEDIEDRALVEDLLRGCYDAALRLCSEGRDRVAIGIFDALGDYADSPQQLEAARIGAARRDTFDISGYQALALKPNGTVVASGDDYYGALAVSGWRDIIAVSAGEFTSLGLKADGTVVSTGNFSQSWKVSGWRDIIAIDGGDWHSVGLKSDGTVVVAGWSHNASSNVGSWRDIIAVSAGGSQTLGLKADGTVLAVGDNQYGECNVSSWSDIVEIYAGNYHSVGLRADGTVVAAGKNDNKQCNVSSWTDIVDIAAGGFFTAGLRSDGTVVIAGSRYDRARDAEKWTDIVAIRAGTFELIGLKADGTVLVTGNNKDLDSARKWTGIRLP